MNAAPLVLRIRHALPGRLRIGFSHPLHAVQRFSRDLRSHPGIDPVVYTPATHSALLRFDPELIRREELLVRVALAFAQPYGNPVVRIESKPAHEPLTASVALSGAALLAAGLGRAARLPAPGRRIADGLAGLSTAWAVLSHAAQELRNQGAYHPEVVSVAYLALGMIRGNTLSAAWLTWVASFGRHMVQSPASAIEVQPGDGENDVRIIAVEATASGWQAWLRLVPELMRTLAGAGRPGGDLLSRFQEVSRLHDQVIEALGFGKKGISIQVGDR